MVAVQVVRAREHLLRSREESCICSLVGGGIDFNVNTETVVDEIFSLTGSMGLDCKRSLSGTMRGSILSASRGAGLVLLIADHSRHGGANMFDLAMPWWEFVLRAAVSYIRTAGYFCGLASRRSFGQLAPFDVIVLIMIGGLLRPAVTGNDHSLLGPFISIVTILVLDKLVGRLAASFPIIDRLLERPSVLLAEYGQRLKGALEQHGVSPMAFERELRQHGVRNVAAEQEEVRLEGNKAM